MKSQSVVLAIKEVVSVQLHLSLPLSPGGAYLASEGDHSLTLDSTICLVGYLSKVNVSLIVGVDAGQDPLVVRLVGNICKEL